MQAGAALPSELVCKADHVTNTEMKGVKLNEGLTREDRGGATPPGVPLDKLGR